MQKQQSFLFFVVNVEVKEVESQILNRAVQKQLLKELGRRRGPLREYLLQVVFNLDFVRFEPVDLGCFLIGFEVGVDF